MYAWFQSTFPHGERLDRGCRWGDRERFNPRSRTGNDRQQIAPKTQPSRFQSTFPHGERQSYADDIVNALYVSIHVPARGTTEIVEELKQSTVSFNPRSRTGNDRQMYLSVL